MAVDPNRIRCIDPLVSPQYPFNDAPKAPERSEPRYASISDYEARIPLRDGIRLAADVIRPHAGGMKFPALVTTSVYTRQLQRSVIALGQNEAGVSEFWVPRGYAHVIVDVGGCNDSEGEYDLFGAQEQQLARPAAAHPPSERAPPRDASVVEARDLEPELRPGAGAVEDHRARHDVALFGLGLEND